MNQQIAAIRIKYILIFIATLIPLFTPGSATSGEGDLTHGSVIKYTAGILSGALIHEGSHALVASVTGTHMSWELGTYNQPLGFTEKAGSDAKGMALNSAGFVSQALGSEVILQWDKIDKNDAFTRGIMTWNILNPILYSLDYWFFRFSNKNNGRKYQGDLEGIEHYSNEATANAFALTFSAIALFQGYRFLKTQNWAPDWLKGEMDKVSLTPLRSGGFIIGYNISF